MSQVSKRRISPGVSKRIDEILAKSLQACSTTDEAHRFISDLLTPTEKTVVAKRLAIAMMIAKKFTFAEIGEVLKVSPPTINKVREWMATKGDGFTSVLAKVIRDESTNSFWSQLSDAIDDVMVSYKPGTNWKQVKLHRLEKEKKQSEKKIL